MHFPKGRLAILPVRGTADASAAPPFKIIQYLVCANCFVWLVPKITFNYQITTRAKQAEWKIFTLVIRIWTKQHGGSLCDSCVNVANECRLKVVEQSDHSLYCSNAKKTCSIRYQSEQNSKMQQLRFELSYFDLFAFPRIMLYQRVENVSV